MCDLCKENGGEPTVCVDCGRLICFDYEGHGDSVMASAYVTMSGDLFCNRCGPEYDEIETHEDDGFYPEEHPTEYDFPYPEKLLKPIEEEPEDEEEEEVKGGRE